MKAGLVGEAGAGHYYRQGFDMHPSGRGGHRVPGSNWERALGAFVGIYGSHWRSGSDWVDIADFRRWKHNHDLVVTAVSATLILSTLLFTVIIHVIARGAI